MGEMIYVLRRVDLIKFMQNEPIVIVKNANLIGFLNRLAISFNLTNSQPLDTGRGKDPVQ